MKTTLTIKSIWTFLLLFVGLIANAQDVAQYGTPFTGVPDPRDVNIYQVAVGSYSSTRNFAGVTAGLDNIKALGINVIYLMPTYPVGASGSPYSITDFGGVNASFGTLTDLRNLVAGAHSRGMAVILDWVGYETAIDHPWKTSHPDWYTGVNPFPDCSALNTTNATVRSTMIQYMRNWIFTANIDGFRCDWADYSEQDYWTAVISNLRGITSHKLLMLAEGSNEGTSTGCTTCGNNQPGAHYAEGFDFIFGENFYWNFMKKVYNNGETALNVDGINTGEYTGASATNMVARYMSNHDEYGSDGSPFSWMGGKAPVMSAFVIATYMRGVPFIYNGIEVGNTSSITYPWNTGTINWTQDLTVLADMKKIMAFRNSSDAIRRGTPTSYTTANVVAFKKVSTSQSAFVAVNVRNSSQTFTLPSGVANTTWYDGFTNTAVTFGSTITLSAYQYVAYVNTNVSVTGVSVSPTSASIAGTGTQQLTESVLPANATNKSVTWTSSNTAVATVSSTGLVSGVAPGTATITVKTNDGAKTATSAITVTSVAVTGVSVSPTTASIYTGGGTSQLTATIAPTNATNKSVTWTSSNTAVATVSSTGLVTAVAVGTATITVKTTDGAKTATSVITVLAQPTLTVYFYKPAAWGTSIKVYNWSGVPAGNLADGVWPGVAMTVYSGSWYTYTFKNITATNLIFNDGTNQTADLNRTKTGWYMDGVWYDSQPSNVAVTSVTVSPTTGTIATGGTIQLTATVNPSNATDKTVSWTSSNTGVATVNASGLVSGVGGGSAVITVKTTDGAKTATATITVTAPAATYYTIKNRWKGTYLYDAGGNVGYGATVANNNYKWQKVTIDATYFWLKNLGTGEYMHIENQTGSVQCTAVTLDWWSAQWSADYIDGTWNRIRNRWQTGNIIHVENQTGSAQYAGAQDGWYSAQWQFQVTTQSAKVETSVENTITNPNFIIYPNPLTNKILNIDMDADMNNSESVITCTDLTGKVLLKSKMQGSGSINLDLTAGIYMLTITNGTTVETKKLLVK